MALPSLMKHMWFLWPHTWHPLVCLAVKIKCYSTQGQRKSRLPHSHSQMIILFFFCLRIFQQFLKLNHTLILLLPLLLFILRFSLKHPSCVTFRDSVPIIIWADLVRYEYKSRTTSNTFNRQPWTTEVQHYVSLTLARSFVIARLLSTVNSVWS